MTGGDPFDGEGDPDYVNVIAPEQYLPRYTLFTDPTYPETNLVVVRARDAKSGAFPDVSLDCLGSIPSWSAVDAAGRYEFARIDLSTGDFVAQGGCDNGVHTMTGAFAAGGTATPAFGVTVWGWGNNVTYPPHDDVNPKSTRWVSYAYPAGANFKPLNDVVLPAKSGSPASLSMTFDSAAMFLNAFQATTQVWMVEACNFDPVTHAGSCSESNPVSAEIPWTG